jgi:hypothetical protein
MIKVRGFRRVLIIGLIVLAILVFTGCGAPNIEKLKAKQDVEGLIKALEYDGSESGIVGPAAREALVELGSEAVKLLVDALNHKELRVSGTASRLLGEIGDTRAVEPLIKALDKEDIFVTSAYSLGQIGDISAVEPLMKKLDDFQNSNNEYNYDVAVDALTMVNIKYILPVNNGQGVSAKPYVENDTGIHPVLVADENLNVHSFKDNLNSLIPIEWRSLGFPEKIELVLCYKIEEIELEKCRYSNDTGTITRIRQDWNVNLREAATGNIIATDILKGDSPTKCPKFRGSGNPDIEHIGEVSDKTLIEWLRPFVE